LQWIDEINVESGDKGVFSDTSLNQGYVKDQTLLSKKKKTNTSAQHNIQFQKNCKVREWLQVENSSVINI
jgi:hypothetical protein